MRDGTEGDFEAAAETLLILRGLAASHEPGAKIIRELTAETLIAAIDELWLYEDGQLNQMARIIVDDHVALLPQDDINRAGASERLCYLRSCALAFAQGTEMIGSVTAGRIVDAIETYLRGAVPPSIDLDEPRDYEPRSTGELKMSRKWRQAVTLGRRRSWPRPRAGELKIQWGYSADDGYDLFFCGGEGVPRADRSLMHYALTAQRWTGPFDGMKFEPSLIDQLASRGYDPSTLRFSIQKRD
ncbi:hypothetical protein KUV57_12090 [Epibacterium sp. DP7N7-1]|nr:hypothetical protein [Epibacterium sp. DP7N7-1]